MEVTAIPNQTVVRARESTLNVPGRDTFRKDLSKRIHRLDPDAAPFTLLLQRARTETCNEPEYWWQSEELPAMWSQAAAQSDAGAATLVVDHARYFSVGDIFNVIQAGAGNGLKCRVTGVNTDTNTLTIVRGIGGTADANILNDADIQIIGNAYAEGSPLGLEKSHVEFRDYNYVQIFRTPFGVTGTQDATVNFMGKDRPRLRAKKAIEHKLLLEKAALFGERNIDNANLNNPRRYTGGAFYFLTDNIYDTATMGPAGTTLTAPELWTWLQDVYNHTGEGSGERVLFASGTILTVFDQMALTTGNVSINVAPRDRAFGLSVKQWFTSHGTFNIVRHRLLDNGLGGGGYGGHGILLDPSAWFIRHLPGRNTHLRPDVGAKGDDAWSDEYFTELGFQVTLPETQGILKGVTTA